MRRQIKCESVDDGMLGGEVAVSVRMEGGRNVSMFLPREQVQGDQITVRVLDTDNAFGLVELPSAPIDGPRVIKVRKDCLL